MPSIPPLSLSMRTLITLAAALIVLALAPSCQQNNTQNKLGKDSVEYAMYESIPLNDPEEIEPTYISFDMLGLYQPGDTVLVNLFGVAKIGTIILPEEKDKLIKVKLGRRMDINKIIPISWTIGLGTAD